MKKYLSILILIISTGIAQDITNKLGGTSESDTYDVTDSNDNVLLRVEGNGEVGIGTDYPDANLDIHGTVKAFGAFIDTFSTETYHLAESDGIVVAWLRGLAANSSTTLYGRSDVTVPSPKIVTQSIVNISQATLSITFPVKKGYWWHVSDGLTGANTDDYEIIWIPLGQ